MLSTGPGRVRGRRTGITGPDPLQGAILVVGMLAAAWIARDLTGHSVLTWAVRVAVAGSAATLVHRWLRHAAQVTAREQEVLRAQDELRAQREVLIQTVSHEFRTPLAIIHGVTETLLSREGLAPNRQRALLASARNAAHRLDDLTGVVLAVVEPLGKENQEVILVDALVEDLAREFTRLGGPDRLRVDTGDDAFALVSNPDRIRLILRAIIENGLRFSPADLPVRVLTDRHGGRFETRVRDQGRGLTSEVAARAFEPLVQGDASTTREHGGLGIGLFAARQATVQLGGDIELVPRADGVDVVVTLPQRRETDRQLRDRESVERVTLQP